MKGRGRTVENDPRLRAKAEQIRSMNPYPAEDFHHSGTENVPARQESTPKTEGGRSGPNILLWSLFLLLAVIFLGVLVKTLG